MSLQPNLRLFEARTARGWSQKQLADKLGGITRQTVNRWETGRTHPSPYYRGLLIALFGLDGAALGLEPDQAAALPPAERAFLYDPTTPQPVVGGLVGRDELLAQIKYRLITGYHLALYGLPGVGKTAVAMTLAYDPDLRQHFEGIFWAGLGRQPSVEEHLSRWSLLLGAREPAHPTRSAWAQALRVAIGERRLLLVLDDAWSLEDALALKVGGPGCAYLLTTRSPLVAATFAHEITAVPVLSEENGLLLLTRQAGMGRLQQAATRDQAAELADALRTLVRLVGGLPLALTLMATWLRVQAHAGQVRRVQQAILELSQDPQVRLHLAGPQTVLEAHPSLPPGTSLSLKQVIGVSVDLLTEEARAALYALSVFPAKPNSFAEEAAIAVANCTTETLDGLLDAGLIETTGEDRYTLHQTIADYAATQRSPDDGAEKRLVRYYKQYVENHHNDHSALDQENTNILAALQASQQVAC